MIERRSVQSEQVLGILVKEGRRGASSSGEQCWHFDFLSIGVFCSEPYSIEVD
jgi:hypothetical protein